MVDNGLRIGLAFDPCRYSLGVKKQKAELCRILDELQKANFNTILFQARIRGDVIYPSAIESYNEILTGRSGKSPGYDPLAFAIDECHKRGMELHAWLFLYLWVRQNMCVR